MSDNAAMYWTILVLQEGTDMINAEQAKELLDKHPESILLDVRELDEYTQGHIPGAALMPSGLILQAKTKEEVIESGLGTIALEKELADVDAAPAIIVYCYSGVRSKKVAKHLERLGFTAVYDAGGIIDWPYEITV